MGPEPLAQRSTVKALSDGVAALWGQKFQGFLCLSSHSPAPNLIFLPLGYMMVNFICQPS